LSITNGSADLVAAVSPSGPSGCHRRGAVGAARDLALGQQPWVERGYDAPWVEFILKMCRVLEAANVTPVVIGPALTLHLLLKSRPAIPTSPRIPPPPLSQLVFDGCRLPAKAATNQQRRERRQVRLPWPGC
jgi:hypothetical protein